MRTVKEAKALAAYLEVKPEMDRKEREARKDRWRKVVEAAESREAGGGASRVRFDDVEWLEETEEERVRTREAVERVMATLVDGNGEGSSGSGSDEEGDDKAEVKEMKFAGWDEDDDEFMSSDDDDMSDIAEDEEEEEEEEGGKGKGKQTV
jgi:hypothetical protein